MNFITLNIEIENMVDISFGESICHNANRYYAAPAVSDIRKIGYFTEQKIESIKEHIGIDITQEWTYKEIRQKYGIMCKPGKFFKHVLPDASDKEIQKLVSKYFALVGEYDENNTNGFYLASDIEEIKHYYCEDSYQSVSGSLGESCMRHDTCSGYIDFYDNYNVSLLVLKNKDDEICGRALVWHNVEFPYINKTLDFMDRIYVNNDNDIELFKNYAIENNMVHKQEQNYNNKTGFVYNNESFVDSIVVGSIQGIDFSGEFPYVDTMSELSTDGSLSNTTGDISLDDTDGGPELYFCDDCGKFVLESEEYWVNDQLLCEDCIEENYTRCEHCGEYVRIEDSFSDDYNNYCEDCFSENFYTCESCNEPVHRDYVMFSKDEHELPMCEYCYDQEHTDCEECGDSTHNDNLINGLCEDCEQDRLDEIEEKEIEAA